LLRREEERGGDGGNDK